MESFINEFKLQADRDLTEAEAIMKNGGPIEHVAWFCEQGFEKIVKYVYAYFKLNIQNQSVASVYDNMKAKSHMRTAELIINMQREFYQASWNAYEKAIEMPDVSGLTDEMRAYMKQAFEQRKVDGVGFFDKQFDRARGTIENLLRAKEDYNDMLRKSTEENLRAYLSKFDYGELIEKLVRQFQGEIAEKRAASDKKDLSFAVSPVPYQNHMLFFLKVMAMAPRVLPYAETSRYPMKECNYDNLRMFRKLEPQLRPYFAYLITELRQIYEGSDPFLESMSQLKQFM